MREGADRSIWLPLAASWHLHAIFDVAAPAAAISTRAHDRHFGGGTVRIPIRYRYREPHLNHHGGIVRGRRGR